MNERIRELAEQATTEEADGFKYFDREKFAELIVCECVEQSLKVSHRNDDMGSIIANMIKEHFGVE
jgi:hypothetical protein